MCRNTVTNADITSSSDPTTIGTNSSSMPRSPHLQNLALYTSPTGARLVILDFGLVPSRARNAFTVVCTPTLDSACRRRPLQPFLHVFPSADLCVIECVDCASPALYEFIYTYNYFADDHTTDFAMKRQLAMIWQYLVYDPIKHQYRCSVDLIAADTDTLFSGLGGGSLSKSVSAVSDFALSKSCPSYKDVSNVFNLRRGSSSEKDAGNVIGYPNMFRVVQDARKLDVHAFPSQVSITASVEGALTHLGAMLKLEADEDTETPLLALRNRFQEAASELQKFVCHEIADFLTSQKGYKVQMATETNTALPFLCLQRAESFSPYKVKADLRLLNGETSTALELKTRWSGANVTERDESHFAWQAILQSMSTHTTSSKAFPSLLIINIPNEQRVTSINMHFIAEQRLDMEIASEILKKQLKSCNLKCVLNYGSFLMTTSGAAFNPVLSKTHLHAPSLKFQMISNFKIGQKTRSSRTVLTGKESGAYRGKDEWSFRQPPCKNGRPYFLFDAVPSRLQAWAYKPRVFDKPQSARPGVPARIERYLGFLFVCSILNQNTISDSDFQKGAISTILKGNDQIIFTGDGYIFTGFFSRVLKLLRRYPESILAGDTYATLSSELTIASAGAASHLNLGKRALRGREGAGPSLSSDGTQRGALSIPTLDQRLNAMKITHSRFHSFI